MKFSRVWAMPSHDTFTVLPIRHFVHGYLRKSKVSVDPFSRNCGLATYTNDLNPETNAMYHLDANEFAETLSKTGVLADLVLFDPPYSPRQISECYKGIGKEVTMQDTQGAALYKGVRDSLLPLIPIGGIALSFGWNTVGFGINRGFEIIEILLVCHGGAHNDTICMAEKRISSPFDFGE